MFKNIFSKGPQFTQLSQSEDYESMVSDSSSSEKLVPQKQTLMLREAGALVLMASLLSGLVGLGLGNLFLNQKNSKIWMERVSNYCEFL